MDLTDIERIADGKVLCICGNSDWSQFLYIGVTLDALMAGCKWCGRVVMRRGDQWGALSLPPVKTPAQPIGVIEGVFGRWIIIHENSPGLAWSGSRWVTHDHGVPTGEAQVCNFATREEAQEYIDANFNAFYPQSIPY
jgi:hypothetical protein